MVIFPLAPDQSIAQMWSNGARGGCSAPTCHGQTDGCRDRIGVGKGVTMHYSASADNNNTNKVP